MNIAIGLPIDDGHRCEFWRSYRAFLLRIRELLPDNTNICEIENPGDSAVARARNNIAHRFLEDPKGEYLLFLDTDIDFDPEQLGRLIRMARPDAIVCGQYALKQPEFRMCWNGLRGEYPDDQGMLKVGESGTGCMIIPRQILQAMIDKDVAASYTCDMHKDERRSFFDMGVVAHRWLSEDWLICRRARALGYPILVDTETIYGHHGWIRYPIADDFLIRAIASRCVNDEILAVFKSEIDSKAKVNVDRASQAPASDIKGSIFNG